MLMNTPGGEPQTVRFCVGCSVHLRKAEVLKCLSLEYCFGSSLHWSSVARKGWGLTRLNAVYHVPFLWGSMMGECNCPIPATVENEQVRFLFSPVQVGKLRLWILNCSLSCCRA